MRWKKYTIETTTSATDLIGSMLMDLGIEGIEIEDKIPLSSDDKEKMFVDILPEIEPDDGTANVSFYLEIKEDDEEAQLLERQALLADVRRELIELQANIDAGSCSIEEEETQDIDWINNWKEYFHQFEIDDILIVPSWEEPMAKEGQQIIHMDPGTAFGTGMHETTQLCIRELKKFVKPDMRVLDVGCGSGILGMLALKFGASKVVGTDLDVCAIEATHENMKRNDLLETQYQVFIGNILDDEKLQGQLKKNSFDIAVSNILAEVLYELTPSIVPFIKPGGFFITSGIIEGKEGIVSKAMELAGLTVLSVEHQGEWSRVTGRKPE